MKKRTALSGFLLIVTIIWSCGSKDDDCTKTIAIPQYYVENNQIKKGQNVMLEVPCDFPDAEDLNGPPELENFTYEVHFYTFIPDTGNNTSRLKFEIKLNNENPHPVKGLPFLTTKSGDFEFTRTYGDEASVPCDGIPANSSCMLTFDKEYPLDLDLGIPEPMTLVNVKYYTVNN